jgi:Histidine kinase
MMEPERKHPKKQKLNWYEFIFSDVRRIRIIRHFLFWTIWWIYFYGSRYFYPRAFVSIYTSSISTSEQFQKITGTKDFPVSVDIWNSTDLVRCLLMFGIHMIAAYAIITFLLRFLLESRYFSFLIRLTPLLIVLITMSRFIDTTLLPLITGEQFNFHIPLYASIFLGLISPIKIISIAMTIKLAKHWWLSEKERMRLEKEKSEAELQLLKTQIHPHFLFCTLNNIQSFALEGSPKAPEMVLKLSDILSFMLYECEGPGVLLEREVRNIKDFLALERIRLGDKIEMSFNVTGKQNEVQIAPLLLFAFVENSMRQIESSESEEAWINIELDIKENNIEMIIASGKTIQDQNTPDATLNFRSKAEKRLKLQYPGRYFLKVTEGREMMITTLQISAYCKSENELFIQSTPENNPNIQVSEIHPR